MKILLTGATGYIGKRLLPAIVGAGHSVVCAVRDPERFTPPTSLAAAVSVIRLDLLDPATLKNIPTDIDAAYYLVHSMSQSRNFQELEQISAINFCRAVSNTNALQVIYLSGIVNPQKLSRHLRSRKNVETELSRGNYQLTTLRAGIIIGSGSASFEIIRDLVEKLPIMIAPKWLDTLTQPIAIADIITLLAAVLAKKSCYGRDFDIGGPDILSYREMLLGYAKVRKLRRRIYTVPLMTPRLSSYWLYFVTSTSYALASSLVGSMGVEVICRNRDIFDIIECQPISYHEALQRAFLKIESREVVSSWKDSFVSGGLHLTLSEFIDVPRYGCFSDYRELTISDRRETISRIWRIGGEQGWYYGDWLWRLRGGLDKIFGGVGVRRGRTDPERIKAGDALDFWRVLYANKEEGRLLLFAEMKLPGDAWLEFSVRDNVLCQRATFRPRGVWGRIYWYSIFPIHGFIFPGMIRGIGR